MFKTFVISLTESPRRTGIVQSFLIAGVKFQFIDASNPDTIKALPEESCLHYFQAPFHSRNAIAAKWATLGCALSHALLWEKLDKELDDSEAGILIFEDDVELDRNFKFNLARILNDAGSDFGGFDIIFFPGWEQDERYTTPQMATHRYLSRMVNFTLTSTAGYLVRRASLRKFIDTVLPFGNEVDIHIAFLRSHIKIGLAPLWPHLFKAQISPSERLRMDHNLAEEEMAKPYVL